MKQRAITPEQKREIIEEIYKIWLERPELRLGQLFGGRDIFYVEDYALIKLLEQEDDND